MFMNSVLSMIGSDVGLDWLGLTAYSWYFSFPAITASVMLKVTTPTVIKQPFITTFPGISRNNTGPALTIQSTTIYQHGF